MSRLSSVSASPPEQDSSLPLSWCCGPLIAFLTSSHRQYHEKMPSAVVTDQPESHPKPLFGLGRRSESLNLSRLSTPPKKNNTGGRFSFANRLRNQSDASSRRPLISAPTDFRHLDSGSGSLHQRQPSLDQPSIRRVPARPERNRRLLRIDNEPLHHQTSTIPSLQSLELSIHMPHNRLSSLLPPRFEVPCSSPSPSPTPPPAYARNESTLAYPSHASSALRSYPSFSFHLPRKHHRDSPPASPTNEPQMAAPRPKKGRRRSNTASGVEAMKERVANAMQEMENLQKQIDDVVERQSMYSHSRPSSAHSMARTVPDMEPMPSIPALLPPSAPSFAERLQGGGDIDRPRTAPPPPATAATFPQRESSLPAGRHEQPANTNTNTTADLPSPPPPPPLPLVLRPPLRKKKSFSTVSKWHFSDQSHSKLDHAGRDSITNMPRPIKDTEGFYQSITMPDIRQSIESLRSHSTTDYDESENEILEAFQTYSPPGSQDVPPLERCSTFGPGREHVRLSVGVAI